MISRLKTFLTCLFALFVVALLALAPAQAKPALGGYQLFEPPALEHSQAIQRASLGNFDDPAKIASECCNAPNTGGVSFSSGPTSGATRFSLNNNGQIPGYNGELVQYPTASNGFITTQPNVRYSVGEWDTASLYAGRGQTVVLRGEGIEGPDLRIGSNWFDNKVVAETGPNSLTNAISSARRNFGTGAARDAGLSRSDTRAFVDVRGNQRWDNPQSVIGEVSGGLPYYVSEVRVRTSGGIVHWNRGSQTPTIETLQ